MSDAIRTIAQGLSQLADALDVADADEQPWGQIVRTLGQVVPR